MGGVHTIRGISFQHAYAIQLALDVIDDPNAESLTVEGEADVTDIEVARTGVPARAIYQVRSREEPYNWAPGEIAEVVRAWQDAGGGVDAPLCFITDAPASPDTTTKLKPALERARAGALSEEDREYLCGYGIDPERAACVEVATRTEATGALLAMAENRVRRHLLLSQGVVGDLDDRHAVDELFRAFAVEGGSRDMARRTFARADIAEIFGVDLAVLDSGSGWNSEVAVEYRAALASVETPHRLVELVALIDPTANVPALALQVSADRDGSPLPALALSDREKGAGLCGAAGTGKTTTAQQIAAAGALAGRTVLVVSASGYRRGDLERRTRRALETVLGRPFSQAAVGGALAEAQATLIVDGLSGLSVEQEDGLAADIRAWRERFSGLRLLIANRERAFARRFGLDTYTLNPLAREEREDIADGVVDNPKFVVADLEHTLEEVVDNPLLFVMALSLNKVGVAATNRAEIFSGFLDGLRAREQQVTVDEADLAALRLATVALTAEARYDADRYWWLTSIEDSLKALRTQGVYEIGERSAEAVFRRLVIVGLLFEDDVAASVSLLHDAFRDYLASVALTRGEAVLPRPITAEWEMAIELDVEQGGLTDDLARILVTDSPIAATRAARYDTTNADPGLTGELVRVLVERHLGKEPIGSEFSVVLVDGAVSTYAVAVTGGGDRQAVGGSELSPLAAVALPKGSGSLALATALFRVFVSQLTNAEPSALMRPIPTGQAALAEAAALQFEEQRVCLTDIATRLFPTLADRIVDGVGWRGLRAVVRPAYEVELLPGEERTVHGMSYSLEGDEINVTAAASEDDDDTSVYQATTTAESFLQTSPADVARIALVKQLDELLPEAI